MTLARANPDPDPDPNLASILPILSQPSHATLRGADLTKIYPDPDLDPYPNPDPMVAIALTRPDQWRLEARRCSCDARRASERRGWARASPRQLTATCSGPQPLTQGQAEHVKRQ